MFVRIVTLSQVIGFLIKVLLTIQEELVERGDKKVKEWIRNSAIVDIMVVLDQVLLNFQFFSVDTINDCLLALS